LHSQLLFTDLPAAGYLPLDPAACAPCMEMALYQIISDFFTGGHFAISLQLFAGSLIFYGFQFASVRYSIANLRNGGYKRKIREVSNMKLELDLIIEKVNLLKEIPVQMENSVYGLLGPIAISFTLFTHSLAFYGVMITFASYGMIILKKLKDKFVEPALVN